MLIVVVSCSIVGLFLGNLFNWVYGNLLGKDYP